MANGTLQIKVTAAGGTMPLPDATVRISDALGNVVHMLYTDRNGMSPMVTLFAPSRSYSLSPYASHPAYSVYEIKVNHFGYVPQIVRGVRIYEGESTVLPVDLEPRSEHADHTVNIIEIPPPGASGRY